MGAGVAGCHHHHLFFWPGGAGVRNRRSNAAAAWRMSRRIARLRAGEPTLPTIGGLDTVFGMLFFQPIAFCVALATRDHAQAAASPRSRPARRRTGGCVPIERLRPDAALRCAGHHPACWPMPVRCAGPAAHAGGRRCVQLASPASTTRRGEARGFCRRSVLVGGHAAGHDRHAPVGVKTLLRSAIANGAGGP